MAFEIRDVPEEGRYEAREGEAVAGFVTYRRTESGIVFTHTEVDGAYAGRGVGAALVRQSLDDARAAGWRVVPVCPFYRSWLGRHRDYADLVDAPAPGEATE